ncbi:MAG: KpsF/GutQ family sugar-phosphate isomerase [Planctomycetes bacterium]|nr:KpsF/GutQ family sugar-phosphate isomerase [Planctomycetota bacterium]
MSGMEGDILEPRSGDQRREDQLSSAKRILDAEATALARVRDRLDATFSEVVSLILGLSGRVVVTGMGKAGLIAQKVSATLASTGTPSIFLHPAEAFHGDLGRVVPGDVLLAFSKSGETEELLRLVPCTRAFDIGVVSVTESRESTLGSLSDHVLELGPIDEPGPHGLAPSASTLAMLAIGDAIALVVQEGRSFGPDDFARFHPGGSLGRSLMRVSEVMRTGDFVPISRSGRTIRETLVTMTQTPGRPGAAIIVDEAGRLVGYFTDGDLRRHLEQQTENLLDLPIDRAMTTSPRTSSPDRLASEALALLRRLAVDNMPIVDQDGRVVGLLDLQDLLALKF